MVAGARRPSPHPTHPRSHLHNLSFDARGMSRVRRCMWGIHRLTRPPAGASIGRFCIVNTNEGGRTRFGRWQSC